MRQVAAVGLALAGVVVLVGCGTDSGDPPKLKTFTVSGEVSVWAPSVSARRSVQGAKCSSTRSYADVNAGSQVIVRDANGTKVALGELGAGAIVDAGGGLPACEFHLSVPDVPSKGDVFSVQIGSHDEVTFDRAKANTLQVTFK